MEETSPLETTFSPPGLGAALPLPTALIAPGQIGAEGQIAELSSLLRELDEASLVGYVPPTLPLSETQENQLLLVRLGIASSLFRALRSKHEPSARHSLRVALASSSWALRMELPDALRDEIELAALLHDIGKIGVPDHVLAKPTALSPQETTLMERHWSVGKDILRGSCAAKGIIDTVAYAAAWYDGRRGQFEASGDKIPLGARMLAIVDAFDAMTSDHVYRRAMSRERAFNELYRYAGTQFDPDLVKLFAQLHECDQLKLQQQVARHWLRDLDPESVGQQWRLQTSTIATGRPETELLFQQKLLDNMYDAVVFVDTDLHVLLWNRGAERLTGISADGIQQRLWLPSLLQLRDEQGEAIRDDDCPVAYAIHTGVQWLRRLTIRGRANRDLAVDAHAMPVVGNDGATHGLTLLLHDVSPEISLEERCQNLHELATKDPLTQVANRAEFNRVHEMFIAVHLESKLPCSLIITDIDRFKLVNDTYGHQAGDNVLQCFAALLKSGCRPGDLVARYGGEEFVILCADCDNAAAVRRAEELRKAFSEIPQSALAGNVVTASFGVTEVQPGDNPETMLRRADRALFMAKEGGRNKVVQLGSGNDPARDDVAVKEAGRKRSGDVLLEQDMVCEAPLNVSIEKLRGFVADHHAEVAMIDGHQVQLKVGDEGGGILRRSADRPIRLVVDLRFEEERLEPNRASMRSAAGLVRTKIHVAVSPYKTRDRRLSQATEQARQLLVSFRAYLMATPVSGEADYNSGVLGRAKSFFPWFRRG